MALQMKAARYGSPEVIQPFDIEVPAPRPGEVTIEVRAAGVNPTDWKGITGDAYAGDDPAALPKPVGREVAGVISAIGPGTHRLQRRGAEPDEARLVVDVAMAISRRGSIRWLTEPGAALPELLARLTDEVQRGGVAVTRSRAGRESGYGPGRGPPARARRAGG